MGFDTGSIRFDDKGLVPVILQDISTGEVLTLAWANRQALEETARRGEMVLYSRSRQELWHKGATSGNTMKVVDILKDCDSDAILALVEPSGPACHTGSVSCFNENGPASSDGATFPGKLWRFLKDRSKAAPSESYTARLLSEGVTRVAQKVGEEGVETALASVSGDRKAFISEAADLFFHTMVAALAMDVELTEIWAELEERHRGRMDK
ncbi:MAG TPA: bifunctional phosphoribosyl-AMP cyclohydrolase/phosphoribosyl-ATP pyrophosphatase [Synergistaceae bacterium]|nr:MAG: Phosphoribosyl-ATP diphosphatase [Synergistales bacterium 57_84]KUK88465.1 MAG: Phosphoribosyl-ATP diphosphatase [Synergistales bacterium 58_81]HBG14060.1 bifunctional phosphoribosyl-AMP cyclohydrolase/phosphoribosyl-ATP pyrophosphatase [Synergistaceae bacterium]